MALRITDAVNYHHPLTWLAEISSGASLFSLAPTQTHSISRRSLGSASQHALQSTKPAAGGRAGAELRSDSLHSIHGTLPLPRLPLRISFLAADSGLDVERPLGHYKFAQSDRRRPVRQHGAGIPAW